MKRIAYSVFALWAIAALALPAQTFTTLFSFDGTNGYDPIAALVQGTSGDLYGTTSLGGSTACVEGCGAVFKITPGGALAWLYRFCSQSGCTDGSFPVGRLVQATNGDFYGTTQKGGFNCCAGLS